MRIGSGATPKIVMTAKGVMNRDGEASQRFGETVKDYCISILDRLLMSCSTLQQWMKEIRKSISKSNIPENLPLLDLLA